MTKGYTVMFETILAADLFSASRGWDLDTLGSPGVIGIAGVVFALWKIWRSQQSTKEKMAESMAAMAAAGLTPEVILRMVTNQMGVGAAQPQQPAASVPPPVAPVPSPAPAPAAQPEPTTSAQALARYQQLKALGNDAAAEPYGKMYHQLLKQEQAQA